MIYQLKIKAFLIIIFVNYNTGHSRTVNTKTNYDCNTLYNKYYDDSLSYFKVMKNTFVLKNFDRYEELFLNCAINLNSKALIYVPNNELLLHNSMNYKLLFKHVKFQSFNEIFFFRVKGINFKENQTSLFDFKNKPVCIFYGEFIFYIKEQLVDKNSCKFVNFKNKSSFFGEISSLNLLWIKYSTSTCPFVFLNSRLTDLFLGKISNSLIFKNRLEFIQNNETESFDLYHENFYSLNLEMAYENLTTKLVDKHVFKYMSYLGLYGIVSDIQVDFFKNFKELFSLKINTKSLIRLLNINNNWISYVNNKNNFNLNDIKNQFNFNIIRVFTFLIEQYDKHLYSNVLTINAYKYPDEDFCLFKYFPHNHLVFPIISSTERLECTCTLIWLIQHYGLYLNDDLVSYKFLDYYMFQHTENLDFNLSAKICFNSNLKKRIKECQFDDRKSKCQKSNYVAKSDFQLDNNIDALYLIKWFELIILVFLQPIFCFFGMITNLLTINIIRTNEKNGKLQDNMYKHIYINSIFNIVYCSLTIFKLINVCVFDLSPYCSSIYREKASQYYELYGLFFLGNAIKLCCNFSYISFSLSRLLMSSNKQSKFYKKFEKFNLKIYYFIIFVLSILLSLFKIFEYQINEIYLSSKSFPFKIYDVGNCDKGDVYCNLFRAFNLVNNFIKDCFLFVANLVIDIYLFKYSKKNLENKKKVLNDAKKIGIAIKLKNKMNKMVLINGVTFFVAYSPEFITNILLIAFDKKINDFCYQFMSCSELSEFAQFFNFISIGMQYFILKKFNKNFSRDLTGFKNKITNKKK